MREIKFRAWNNNKMTYDVTVGIVGGKTAVIHLHWGAKTPNYPEFEGFSKTAILMQFTGLKDKNDMPIYEGDIIESTIVGKKFRGQVFWDICSYRVKQDDLDITLGNDKEGARKIIGNIYENPSLTEEKGQKVQRYVQLLKSKD